MTLHSWPFHLINLGLFFITRFAWHFCLICCVIHSFSYPLDWKNFDQTYCSQSPRNKFERDFPFRVAHSHKWHLLFLHRLNDSTAKSASVSLSWIALFLLKILRLRARFEKQIVVYRALGVSISNYPEEKYQTSTAKQEVCIRCEAECHAGSIDIVFWKKYHLVLDKKPPTLWFLNFWTRPAFWWRHREGCTDEKGKRGQILIFGSQTAKQTQTNKNPLRHRSLSLSPKKVRKGWTFENFAFRPAWRNSVQLPRTDCLENKQNLSLSDLQVCPTHCSNVRSFLCSYADRRSLRETLECSSSLTRVFYCLLMTF